MTTEPRIEPLAMELPAELAAAMALLRKEGGSCRIVGGSVRDAVLGRTPKDFDVEVFGLSLERIASALQQLGKTDLVGKSFCVVKLWTNGQEFDFSIPRRESKEGQGHRGFTVEGDVTMGERSALKRRDFTINALMYDPERSCVVDHFGGLDDLAAGVLRHVSDAFAEDPLRVLRAMQFAARFDLRLASQTAALCRSMKDEFWTLPKERIWVEWEKWASQSAKPSRGLQALAESGWLQFFPELLALQRTPQDPEWHPEGDVWIHTQCCVDALTAQTDWTRQNVEKRRLRLFATLCHDLGKATCTRFAKKRGKLRWISPGHDQAGIPLAASFLTRIGAPKALVDAVPKLVGNHHVLNSAPSSGLTANSVRRLATRLFPATLNDLQAVMMADHLGRPPVVSEEQAYRLDRLKEQAAQLALEAEAPKPILMGRHLIERGEQPGPHFKAVLNDAFEAQLDGEFSDLDGALNWLRDHSPEPGSPKSS